MRSILLCGARAMAGLLLANSSLTLSRGQTPVAADLPAEATNIVELRRLAAETPVAAHSIALEGVVWWSNPDTGRFIFHDDSGSQELEIVASGRSAAAGDRVRLTGNSSIVAAGAILCLGWHGALIDHDGVHSLVERSNSLFLRAGRHPVLLEWFNGAGRFGLNLEYEGPKIPRQTIPNSVLFRIAGDPEQGLNYRAYSGKWRSLPDFNSLQPVKTGTTPNFNLDVRIGDTATGLSFSGEIEVPRDGIYTFYLKSDDGSRLFIGAPTLQWTVLGRAEFPAPKPIALGQPLSIGQSDDGCWVQIEGKVIAAHKNADRMRLELRAGINSMAVEIANSASLAADRLLNQRIRATGFCRKAFTLDEEQIAGTLRVPGAAQIEMINAPDERASVEPKPNTLPLLVTATAVRELKPEEALRGYPVRVRGVVTCVQPDRSAFVIQDRTSGLYVSASSGDLLPNVGEFVEVNGVTGEPGIAQVQQLKRLGDGILPDPLHPGWDQLMNGSIDSQWVELSGLIESLTDRSNGWSRAILRTRAGVMKLDLRNGGVHPGPVGQYENAVVRLRGCIFADWTSARRLKVGQARMYNVDVFVDRPAPADLFSVPRTTVDALMRFDPAFDVANQVKVAGQIVYVRGADYFIMDGKDGLRFLAREPLELEAGDLVEAVGYPELSGAAPVLRGAVARKTGRAPLPEPTLLTPDDLIRSTLDSTRVRVRGTLQGLKQTSTNLVFEMQSGSWRFLARLNASVPVQLPSVGSQLELTGVYCAQGGLQVLGADVAPVDLLLNGFSDIIVLSRPPWWTLQRLLVIVGFLACALAFTVLWITQLRRQVEERSAELAEQIRDRQQLEHQKSLEQERIRIAQDLHDELGSDMATISMLAARAQLPSAADEKRSECLEQVRGKAKDMVGALDEIVWAMNPGHDSVVALMSYMDRYARRFLSLANITWQFDGMPEAANRPLDSRQRHHLFMVLKEALTNIVRHSGATQVHADLQLEGNELRLIIVDDGRGLMNGNGAHDSEFNGFGSGLDNMRSRIETLNGRFEIAGEPGRGTEVRFMVPIN